MLSGFATVVPECETKINRFRIAGRLCETKFKVLGVIFHHLSFWELLLQQGSTLTSLMLTRFCCFKNKKTDPFCNFFSIRENIYTRGNVS